MKTSLMAVAALLLCAAACNKASSPNGATVGAQADASSAGKSDAVQQKLEEYAGASATNCGRLDVHAPEGETKGASNCAMQASQGKKPFYVAYDMPGMSVGVAGNAEGKLFSVQSQNGAVTAGDCPSQLRVASSGRLTCFAPGDMGSMGTGHTAVPPGMPNPHALPKSK